MADGPGSADIIDHADGSANARLINSYDYGWVACLGLGHPLSIELTHVSLTTFESSKFTLHVEKKSVFF